MCGSGHTPWRRGSRPYLHSGKYAAYPSVYQVKQLHGCAEREQAYHCEGSDH